MMFTIEEVKDEDQKMAVVDEVLKDLPEWFGIPESTQAPIPEFEGNEKEDKGNQNQTTDIKEPILTLQEITGRIVSRKGKWHDKTDQPTKERIGSQLLATLESEARKQVDYLD